MQQSEIRDLKLIPRIPFHSIRATSWLWHPASRSTTCSICGLPIPSLESYYHIPAGICRNDNLALGKKLEPTTENYCCNQTLTLVAGSCRVGIAHHLIKSEIWCALPTLRNNFASLQSNPIPIRLISNRQFMVWI